MALVSPFRQPLRDACVLAFDSIGAREAGGIVTRPGIVSGAALQGGGGYAAAASSLPSEAPTRAPGAALSVAAVLFTAASRPDPAKVWHHE